MPVGADEHGTLVADLVRVLPRVVGVGERAAGADRVGDEGRVGRPGELLRRRAPGIAAAAGQEDEVGGPKRSIVDRRVTVALEPRVRAPRRPGRAEGTY